MSHNCLLGEKLFMRLSLNEKCEPVYEELEGWPEKVDWRKVVSEGYDGLPQLRPILHIVIGK